MNKHTAPATVAALNAIDLDVLRTFLAIVETTSFTKAAERVGRTPSAVSMQIKKLEDLLGCSVFERHSRAVRLTAHGEMLLGYARRLTELSHEMMARFATPELEGTVRFGAPDDYGHKIMPTVLRRFAETHPNVRVNVVFDVSERLIERFHAGEIDVMIYTAQTDAAEAGARILLEEPLVWAGLAGGTAHLRRPMPVSMWDDCCAWRRRAVDAMAASGIEWRVAYKTAHTMAQRAAIEADLAVAPFPRSFLEPPLTELGAEDGLPSLGRYQIRMRMREEAGMCTQALGAHVTQWFDGAAPAATNRR